MVDLNSLYEGDEQLADAMAARTVSIATLIRAESALLLIRLVSKYSEIL